MNITKENIDTLNAVVKIQLSPEDYLQQVENSIKDLRKKVELKGFRKGHTPVGVVKKMYGNSVLADELNKIINDNLNSYLKDNEIEILGNPIPKDDLQQNIDVNAAKEYEFQYELGLTPEFSLDFLSKNSKFNFHKIIVDDEMLNKEIESMRKRMGKMTNPEDAVQADDVLFVELDELNDDGSVKEGGHHNQAGIPLDMITLDETKNALLKLKIGDSANIDIFKSVDNKTKEEVAKHFLNIADDAVNTTGNNYKLTLKKINRVEPADMDEAFFDQAVGPGKAKTEEEFREVLKAEISKYFDGQSKKILQSDILDTFLKQTTVNLPDDFLKRWMRLTSEKPITAEEVEAQYDEFSKSMKWRLIVNKLIKLNNITVSEEELKEHTRNGLKGYLNVNDDLMETPEYQNWITNMMGNKDHVQRTYDQILEEKLFNFIESQVEVSDKPITLDEFKNLK
jgi:trigger factor